MIKNSDIKVLVGDSISDPGEQRFITQLRKDLALRGVEAVLYANFVTPGRNQRQVDLLIWSPQRVVQVEIKSLDQDLPVLGPVNGPWEQLLPGGTRRSLGKNCYRQAHDATYAVSDQMRSLAHAGKAPAGEKHYRQIDTVVCIYPDIPTGSTLDHFDNVKAIGYPALLERLSTTGPHPVWEVEHWEAFARHLGVFEEIDETPGERRRRVGAEAITDYRRRAGRSFAGDLPELIELDCTLDGQPADRVAMEDRLRSGRSELLHAPSGFGKSHLARHVAARLTDHGELVLWLRADEYDRGHLKSLLARSAAPFSNAGALDLVRSAAANGIGVVVVIDGVNECAPDDQAELLEQLAAFRLLYRCGVLVTSTASHHLPDGLDAVTATVAAPDTTSRMSILTVHGAVRPDRISSAFTTAHELAIAAQCEARLDPEATVADLHDAYIRSLAPSEAVRAGLRAVAAFLHSQLRSSAPLLDVAAHLGSSGGAHLSPELVDDILASALLDVTPGRVRFRHDLLREFLVAEDLVRTAGSVDEFVRRLTQPAHRQLTAQALAIDRDVQRVAEALDLFADEALYTSAAVGELGADVAAKTRISMVRLLDQAGAGITVGSATFEPASTFDARWAGRSWTTAEVAMFTAVGALLLDGEFVDQIGVLLDRTDELFRAIIDEALAAGLTPPLSALVGGTYAMCKRGVANGLPITYVVAGCEYRAPFVRQGGAGHNIASRLFAVPSPGWGRCYLAALTVDGTSPADVAVLPALLKQAIRLGGYHLELHALWAVTGCGRRLDPADQARVVEALENYRPDHWALSSTLVEALAALGQIEPIATLGDICAQIEMVLSHPDHPQAPAMASGIVSSQFEDEDIVGPYCAAVDSLAPLDRLRLILLAATHRDWSMSVGWRMEQLAKAAPCGDVQVDAQLHALFAEHAHRPETKGPVPHENIEVYLHSVAGIAKFADSLPPASSALTDDELAWRLVGNLLLHLDHPDTTDPHLLWDDILHTLPAAAVDVFSWVRYGRMFSGSRGEPSAHDRLVGAFPDQLRRLCEWALDHRAELTSMFDLKIADGRATYAVTMLGSVGNRATVAHLRDLTEDPEFGAAAVAAIRAINERVTLGS
ncbi:MAG TPA: nuclease-related domain-containing protein [Acidimicrobiales bacterium]|nr:nuclease-related domain-containing protein [Acidimicrobiales bacterium]